MIHNTCEPITVLTQDQTESQAWAPHPKFPGVRLKTLISGKETRAQFSCHLVNVEPGSSLAAHVHPDNDELHQVLEGHGQARLLDAAMAYAPGNVALIPRNAEHEVVAGQEGLTLLATFFPALA
ncbi:MAG: cupin domain-containing protein [Desulfovibrio sp.]|nr:MAG: cupin domain-containing protein [Desulfovibrio sp.]